MMNAEHDELLAIMARVERNLPKSSPATAIVDCCAYCSWWLDASAPSTAALLVKAELVAGFRRLTLMALRNSACRMTAVKAGLASGLLSAQVGEPRIALLVGSAARGESAIDSDVDFNFVFPDGFFSANSNDWCSERSARKKTFTSVSHEICKAGGMVPGECCYQPRKPNPDRAFAYTESELISSASEPARFADIANLVGAAQQIGGTERLEDLIKRVRPMASNGVLILARLARAFELFMCYGQDSPHTLHSACSNTMQVVALLMDEDPATPYWLISEQPWISGSGKALLAPMFMQCLALRMGSLPALSPSVRTLSPQVWQALGELLLGELAAKTLSALGRDEFDLLAQLFDGDADTIDSWFDLIHAFCSPCQPPVQVARSRG